jgi:uncharacterized membrane protein AbrB (regulator of aidB expression)
MDLQAKGIITVFGVSFATAILMKVAGIPLWVRLPVNMLIGGVIGHQFDKAIAKENEQRMKRAMNNDLDMWKEIVRRAQQQAYKQAQA